MLSSPILSEIFGTEFLPAFQRISDTTGQESLGKTGEKLSSKTTKSGKTSNGAGTWPTENSPSTSSDQQTGKHGGFLKLDAMSQVLNNMLDNSSEESKIHGPLDPHLGRLGPKIVKFDIDNHVGSFIVSSDRLGVSSQCNFGSVRANVCVFKGKWQYEIQLGSKGVMQLGWATLETKFSSDHGVGDTKDSYSYDGNRMRKWNVTTAPYGDTWQSGDLIGCCIDLDQGQISYSRNGKSLGVAFADIFRGPGIAYFPAASLAFNENIVANFGASPLQFPVLGFLPLQSQKSVEDCKTQLLLTWLDHLLNLYPRLKLSPTSTSPSSALTQDESLTLVLAAHRIFELLVPNIHSAFVVEHRLLPFFAKKLGLPEQISHRDKLVIPALNFQKTNLFLDLMWTYLEETEMQSFTERLSIILMNYFRSNALSRYYPFQHFSLRCLNALATHRRTRRYLIHHILFEKTKITNFLHVRPYDDEVLKEMIPVPWWEGKLSPSPAKVSKDYNVACGIIQENVRHLEAVQIQLLKILMTNTDGTEKRPSSRSVFLRKLRLHIRDAMRPGSVIQHPISRVMCTFFRLIKLVETLWAEEVESESKSTKVQLPDIPSTLFYDTMFNYYEIERLGGLANYLYKSLHEEVSTALHVPDYIDSTQSTQSYSETPMPSFFALSGMTGDPSASAPIITITSVRNNHGPGENPPSGPSQATSTEVQTSNSYAAGSPLSGAGTDLVSTRSGIVGIFHGPQTSPNTESQTENVPDRGGHHSATSSGEISSTNLGGHAGTALLAGTPSGHNVLIPMFTDFRSALAHDPRLTLFPGGFFSFPNFEQRQGARPHCVANEHSGRESGIMDIRLSLIELLDDVIILYNCGVAPHVDKVTALRVAMEEYVKSLNKANHSLKEKHIGPDEKAEINKSIEIFTSKLEDQSRYMAWVQGSVFTTERQHLIVALLTTLLVTLNRASRDGPLFAFVPECHVTTMIQLNWLLLVEMEPSVPLSNVPGIKSLFRDIAEFVATHFADSRIVIAETKDTLTQALTMFICNRTMLTALEEMPEASQVAMMKSILRPYENRAWAQSNWMLVRIWQGNGFGFQYPNPTQTRKSIRAKPIQDEFGLSSNLPPTPSQILQSHVSRVLIANQKFSTNYIHSVLNQLNWAFSEFIGLLQEIQTAANRPERVFIESRQLKICCTCYELTQALLRVLEMTLNLAPQVITDFSRESAENLLGRLCMLISQVLNRIGSSFGSFAQVVELNITGLESVTYFSLLSAVSGILVALLRNELTKVNANELPLTKALLREPSFQVSSLDFLLGQSQTNHGVSIPPPFSFRSHVPADLNEVEIQRLESTVWHLKTWSTRLEGDAESISDDEVCTICYAYPKTTTFKPCNHRACRTCIVHHLLNRGDCFFCKGLIEKVIADDGTVIHDVSSAREESIMDTSET